MDMMGSLSHVGEVCPAGFAIALHIQFTTPRFLFQTYPKKWIEVYTQKGFVLKDPTVIWGFSNTGTVIWSDLKHLDSEGVLDQASTFGLNFGFTFSIDDGDSKSIASFAHPDRDFTQSEIDQITKTISALHASTSDIENLPAETVTALRQMSVEFTRG